MSDIAQLVAAEQRFAVEFEDEGANRYISVRFWKGPSLCKVLICRSELPSTDLIGELASVPRLLSVVPTKADIVACSGCPVDLKPNIDRSSFFSRAVQSCFRLSQLDLPQIMH